LDAVEASSLELPFEEREVLEVVKGMNRDKRSWWFLHGFLQYCWDVIKIDIMGVFQDFHAHSKFVKSLNATFIALISKKSRAMDLKGFRPISLARGVYKNRLRRVMEKVISKPHNAFFLKIGKSLIQLL